MNRIENKFFDNVVVDNERNLLCCDFLVSTASCKARKEHNFLTSITWKRMNMACPYHEHILLIFKPYFMLFIISFTSDYRLQGDAIGIGGQTAIRANKRYQTNHEF